MKTKGKSILYIITTIIVVTLFGLAVIAQQTGKTDPPDRGQCASCPASKESLMQGEGGMPDMQTMHALFADNKKIKRSVKQIAGGIEATTESTDPKITALIIEHAFAMKERLINKQPIRTWDPLFAALFEHADQIDLKISSTEKGVKVVETSTDPYVAQLIQSHAQGVSEFVKEGMAVMHKRHEVPGAKPEANSFLGMGDGATTCPVSGEPVSREFSAEIYGRAVYFCCANCRDAAKKNPALYLKKS